MTYTIAVYSKKTPDDGQRNCPKHVGFYSKINFEKLVYVVGFIIKILDVTTRHMSNNRSCTTKTKNLTCSVIG